MEPGPESAALQQAVLEGVPAPEATGVVSVFNQVSIRPSSGALIAPNVVLAPRWVVSEQPTGCCQDFIPPYPEERIVVANGLMFDLATGEGFWRVQEIVVPPNGEACGNDLALVVLASPVATSEAEPLQPRLGSDVRVAEAITVFGYGAATAVGTDQGTRRKRQGVEVVCTSDCEGAAPGEWVVGEGPCASDGPGVDADGLLVGLVSRTASDCSRAVFGALTPHAAWIRRTVRNAAAGAGIAAPEWAAPPGDGGAETDPPQEPLDPRLCSAGGSPGASPEGGRGDATGGSVSGAGGGASGAAPHSDSGGCALAVASGRQGRHWWACGAGLFAVLGARRRRWWLSSRRGRLQ